MADRCRHGHAWASPLSEVRGQSDAALEKDTREDMVRNRAALMMAALAAAMTPGAVAVMPVVARERPEPPLALLDSLAPTHHPSSPNGGRHATVAQAKRAARKRRNQIRARGHHRQAVR